MEICKTSVSAEGWRRVAGGFCGAGADACVVHPAKVPWHAHIAQPAGELWCCEDMEQSSSQPGLPLFRHAWHALRQHQQEPF
jgi:hypothetical protein